MVPGWIIAICELSLYFIISYKIRKQNLKLQSMDAIIYYWLTYGELISKIMTP